MLSTSRGQHALPRAYWFSFRSPPWLSQAAIVPMKGDDETSVSESLQLRALPRPIQLMYQSHEAEASCTEYSSASILLCVSMGVSFPNIPRLRPEVVCADPIIQQRSYTFLVSTVWYCLPFKFIASEHQFPEAVQSQNALQDRTGEKADVRLAKLNHGRNIKLHWLKLPPHLYGDCKPFGTSGV